MTTGKSNISASTRPDGGTTLVVGATSSLAQALCRSLARRGHTLILAGRDEEELLLLTDDLRVRYAANCTMLPADLLHPDFSAPDFITQVSYLDNVIIAVGDMGGDNKDDPGTIGYTTHINYTVPAQIAAAAAQYLAPKGAGSIVLITSVAGDRGRQSNYLYGSAKAALSTFASGLRNRLFKDGVHVMTVKPGFTDTPMTWGMHSPLIASREYVGERIADAMQKKKDVVYVPFFWQFIMMIICHIPEKIFKKLSL